LQHCAAGDSKWKPWWCDIALQPVLGLIGRYSFPDHISVAIDARFFIIWWYDGHIMPLCLLALSMIFDLCSAP
jgi:hypothetical protein